MGRRVWASDAVRTGWRSDRGTLRSVWSVSKLRIHTAVTLALIGRGAQVREQIAEAKPAVKPAARARHQHARSEQYTHSSRPQIHDGNVNGAGEAAVRKHYTAAAAKMIAEHLGDKRSKFLTLADKADAAEIINLVRGAVQLAATRDALAGPATTPLRTNRHCRSCWHLVSSRRRHLRSKRRRWSDTSGHGDARQGAREGAALHCVTAALREAPSTAPAALQQLTGAEAVAGAVVAGLSNRGPRSIVSAGYEAKRSRRN